jgi:glutaredoxin 3
MPTRKAILYRMVLPDHVCPYGVRARQMLEEAHFSIDEHILSTRVETDAFMEKEGVSTTPQVFIDGVRVGGCAELERYLAEARV